MLVGLRDPELDHLGAEVVAVLVQTGLGIDPEAEVLEHLVGRAGGLDPQHVEVVPDGLRVGVFGRVADLELHVTTWARAA